MPINKCINSDFDLMNEKGIDLQISSDFQRNKEEKEHSQLQDLVYCAIDPTINQILELRSVRTLLLSSCLQRKPG